MRRLFLAFAIAWLLCEALTARTVLTDTAFPPVYIAAATEDGFPRVTGARGNARDQELLPGDLLLRWGPVPLQGASDLEFSDIVSRVTPASRVARVTIERRGEQLVLDVPCGSFSVLWPRVLASLVFVLVAWVLVSRSVDTPLMRNMVAMLMAWAFVFACTFAGTWSLVVMSAVVQVLAVGGAAAFGLRTALLFPHGVSPSHAWLRALPFAFGILGPLDFERVQGALIPPAVAHQAELWLTLVLIATHVGIAIATYRRATAIERRKLKWVYWALWSASALSALMAAAAAVNPSLSLGYYVSLTGYVLIPLALLISITFFNLFDIDRILSSTAWLSLIACAALGVVLTVAPSLTYWVSRALGLPLSRVQVLVTLALATCSVVVSRWLYPRLDALLFSDRATLQRSLSRLMAELARAEDMDEALRVLTDGIVHALRPDTLAVYARDGDGWRLLRAHGAALVPALPSASALVAALAGGSGSLCFELGRRPPRLALSAIDRGFIAAIDARVVLPILCGKELLAAVFIGPKASGDVYVASDLATLSSLAHVLSERVQHLIDLSASDAQVEVLQRYVPARLVSQIVRGTAIDQGERDVTLMFVDIRGYSTYAEQRAPSDVFAIVSNYTQFVSEVVARHSGTVVEFNGDGMMAVFGAPEPLDAKEMHAVNAALEVCSRARNALPDVVSEGASCPVGIGIATGSAFVGTVRATDRHIWTALGASTNRAARLQALTRDLATDLVIDEATYRRIGAANRLFARHANMLLRGHVRRIALYSHTLREPIVQPIARIAPSG